MGHVDLDQVVADLRAGLARAAAAEQWRAVEILEARLCAAEEERAGNVMSIEAARARHTRFRAQATGNAAMTP